MTVTVVKRSGGGSAIRADVWDWWELPRSPASRIPPGAGFLGVEVKPSQEIVEVPEEGQEVTPLPPPRFASTSRVSFVASLVRLIDRKPAYQFTMLPSCGPPSFGVTHEFELTLEDHRGGRVLAKLSQHDPIGPCDPLELRVGGRTFRLDFGRDVLRRIQGLIQRAKPRG